MIVDETTFFIIKIGGNIDINYPIAKFWTGSLIKSIFLNDAVKIEFNLACVGVGVFLSHIIFLTFTIHYLIVN